MSSLVLSGDSSGTVTLAVPSVAGTNTVTIAAQTGTLNAAGPAFSAYQSAAQSLTSGTVTKLVLDTKTFDTNSNFSSNRFTPTISGYYQINGCFGVSGTTGIAYISIYKNNAEYKRGNQNTLNTSASFFSVSDIVYFNGSTDYIEIYVAQYSGISQNTVNGSAYTYISGCLVRGA